MPRRPLSTPSSHLGEEKKDTSSGHVILLHLNCPTHLRLIQKNKFLNNFPLHRVWPWHEQIQNSFHNFLFLCGCPGFFKHLIIPLSVYNILVTLFQRIWWKGFMILDHLHLYHHFVKMTIFPLYEIHCCLEMLRG